MDFFITESLGEDIVNYLNIVSKQSETQVNKVAQAGNELIRK